MRLALSLLPTAGLLAVIPPSPASAQVECAGVEATIVGTAGPDVLVGTPSRDVIVGGDEVPIR